MDVRDRMRMGMTAGSPALKPENVTDNATYEAGEQRRPTTGKAI
jgi:hypothetical protein